MIENRLTWALALALALAAAGCGGAAGDGSFQGVVELDERILGFEVAGRITAMPVQRGAAITPTDVLATLDDSMARTAVRGRTAEAEAAGARAELVRAGARIEEVRRTEAQLRAAVATEKLLVTTRDHDVQLVEQGALPRIELDDVTARLATATAERVALEQRLRELRTGARSEELANAQAQAEAATAAVALEVQRTDRFVLRATEPGEVLDTHVEPGEVVAAGTPVVTVADTTHPFVDVFVPQDRLGGIRVGTAATVRVDATAHPFRGAVEWVNRRTEFTPRYLFSEGERVNLVVRVRVRVDDPGRELHAGVPAAVTLEPTPEPGGAR